MTAEEGEQPGRFMGRVDEDAVFAYARATNDPNPRYLAGDAVPIAFTATLVRSLMPWSAFTPDPMGFVEGRRGGVHGQHDIHLRGEVKQGQDVQWSGEIAGLKQNRGGVLVTRRVIVSDMTGAPLVEHLWTDFLMGATLRGDHPDWALPDHMFPEKARSRLFASQVVPVDRDQAFRYAGVSSDHAPHAMDDAVAAKRGTRERSFRACARSACAAERSSMLERAANRAGSAESPDASRPRHFRIGISMSGSTTPA